MDGVVPAVADCAEHRMPTPNDRLGFRDLVEVLRRRAAESPDQVGYSFVTDGAPEDEPLTYAELDRRARAIGAMLTEAGASGERVLLLFAPGADFIAGFFGCLYAGAVAVPTFPPDPTRLERTLPRLRAVVEDARPKLALTTSGLLELAEPLFELAPELARARWVSSDVAPEVAERWVEPVFEPDSVAFLQYTSGSTATPRGVEVSHRNLLHNSGLIAATFEHGPHSRGVIWLPVYHDMGLIGGVLQPLYSGFPVWLLSPLDFLKRPRLWLETITRVGGTTSGGPNFAFDLCVRRVPPEARSGLDLESWDLAFCGAEPVRAETLERFVAAFGPCGFRSSALTPCYGLAEATLLATIGPKFREPEPLEVGSEALEQGRFEPPADGRRQRLVGCGCAQPGQRVVIVDPATCERLPEDRVGEIWLSGPSVARGYWGRANGGEGPFGARLAGEPELFLRTGDLGFLHGEELYVTGRLKDIVIIRGRNHYPQDLERTVETAHPALRPGCSAAFAHDTGNEEQLVVVAEVERRLGIERRVAPAADESDRQGERRRDPVPIDSSGPPVQGPDFQEIGRAMRAAVAGQHELRLDRVVLVKAGTIPKTSSGKIERHSCRRGFVEGTLSVIVEL